MKIAAEQKRGWMRKYVINKNIVKVVSLTANNLNRKHEFIRDVCKVLTEAYKSAGTLMKGFQLVIGS